MSNKGRLAGSDLAGDHRETGVVGHAELEHGERETVRVRPIDQIRIGQDREGLFTKIVERFIHGKARSMSLSVRRNPATGAARTAMRCDWSSASASADGSRPARLCPGGLLAHLVDRLKARDDHASSSDPVDRGFPLIVKMNSGGALTDLALIGSGTVSSRSTRKFNMKFCDLATSSRHHSVWQDLTFLPKKRTTSAWRLVPVYAL